MGGPARSAFVTIRAWMPWQACCVVGAHESRPIKETERCEPRRAAIRALQQAVERFADATAFNISQISAISAVAVERFADATAFNISQISAISAETCNNQRVNCALWKWVLCTIRAELRSSECPNLSEKTLARECQRK